MKLVVTSIGTTLESQMDSRFGRCAYFVFVETDDMSVEAVKNPSGSLGGGAGIQAARVMAERGVQVVLTGNVGPNAYETLRAAGIEVCTGLMGTVSEAAARYESGTLVLAARPSVESHAGMKPGR